MFGLEFAIAELVSAQRKRELEFKLEAGMQKTLSPEDFKAWKADRTAERRHREVCNAIRDAGNNARPKGTFILGTGRFE